MPQSRGSQGTILDETKRNDKLLRNYHACNGVHSNSLMHAIPSLASAGLQLLLALSRSDQIGAFVKPALSTWSRSISPVSMSQYFTLTHGKYHHISKDHKCQTKCIHTKYYARVFCRGRAAKSPNASTIGLIRRFCFHAASAGMLARSSFRPGMAVPTDACGVACCMLCLDSCEG
jgi:hypothetical protein